MPTQPLSDAEISDALNSLPGWSREADTLVRVFKFDSYLAGIAFASVSYTHLDVYKRQPLYQSCFSLTRSVSAVTTLLQVCTIPTRRVCQWRSHSMS